MRDEKKGDGADTNEGERLCPTPARQITLVAVCRTAHRVVLLVAALALVPSQSFGWGRDGHQVIATLAQSRLSPQARKGVAAQLHGATLASISTYADNYAGLTVTAWTDLLNRSGISEQGHVRPVQWAEESVRVAAQHAYRLPTNHELGQAYLDGNLPVLTQRLSRGGVRLAALLNVILERAAAAH